MLLEQTVELAGHDRLKPVDLAVAKCCPFVVGAGMADEAHRIDQPGGHGAEQLHFLSAHDVGTALADERHARNDRLALSGPDQLGGKFIEPGGAWNVGRLLPAAVGADHPGEEQGLVAELRADFGDRVREPVRSHGEDPLVILEFVGAFSGTIDQIGATIGRAPVDCNETFGPAHAFSAHSRKPRRRDFAPRFSFQPARLVRPGTKAPRRLRHRQLHVRDRD